MTKKRNIFIKAAIITATLTIIMLLVISLSSCITIKLNSIKGSGEIAIKEYEVRDFNRLSFSGIGKIIIEQSDKESLKVEAEKNILEVINVAANGSRLDIGLKRGYINIIPTKDIIFHLTVVDLQKIDLTGVGSLTCENLETERLSIDSSGLGNINMGLIAEDLEIKISGAGKIVMSGEVDVQEIDISGVGTYNGRDLVSKDCEIEISGAGRAVVNVTQALDVRMSGVGNVEYIGNPSVTKNISGVGGTIKSAD